MAKLIIKRSKCPFCKARTGYVDTTCSSCQADLGLLSMIRGMPYQLFNEALGHLEAGALWAAFEKLNAAVVLENDFVEGRNLLSVVSANLGLTELAQKYAPSADMERK
jgi:hypothetical protein